MIIVSNSIRKAVLRSLYSIATLGTAGVFIVPAPMYAAAAPIEHSVGGNYSNGQIPLSELSIIDYPGVYVYPFPEALDAVYMDPTAAQALQKMLQAFHDETGEYLGVNEGYRTLAGQKYWWEKNPDRAAPPGTSNHGWGNAVDIDVPLTHLEWLENHSREFGFHQYPPEKWHYDFIATKGEVQCRETSC